ncbi:Uncharacterised protein [Enterobacter cloacae]|nr:Uncharacterised protein [Enterobacter cloacae]
MTFSCARRMSSLLSGCQSRLACSSKRACIVLRAVISVVPSEVLGRIIIMTPPHRMPTITSHTRAWAISHSSVVSSTLTTGKAIMAAV